MDPHAPPPPPSQTSSVHKFFVSRAKLAAAAATPSDATTAAADRGRHHESSARHHTPAGDILAGHHPPTRFGDEQQQSRKRCGARRRRRYDNEATLLSTTPPEPQDFRLGYAHWKHDPVFTHSIFLRFSHLSERTQRRFLAAIRPDGSIDLSKRVRSATGTTTSGSEGESDVAATDSDGSTTATSATTHRTDAPGLMQLDRKLRRHLKRTNLPAGLVTALEYIVVDFVNKSSTPEASAPTAEVGTPRSLRHSVLAAAESEQTSVLMSRSAPGLADLDVDELEYTDETTQQSHRFLVLHIQDRFVRMILHAVAKYYTCLSFSQDDPATGDRLTYVCHPSFCRKAFGLPPVAQLQQSPSPPLESFSQYVFGAAA
ncbi:hypothetical protein RI367_007858 [Sorochytrium milnesiophthora]